MMCGRGRRTDWFGSTTISSPWAWTIAARATIETSDSNTLVIRTGDRVMVKSPYLGKTKSIRETPATGAAVKLPQRDFLKQ